MSLKLSDAPVLRQVLRMAPKLAFPVIGLVLAVLYLLKITSDLGFDASSAEPTLVICLAIPLGVGCIAWEIRRGLGKDGKLGREEPAEAQLPGVMGGSVEGTIEEWRISAVVVLGIILFAVGVYLIGFLIPAIIFQIAMMWFLGMRKPVILVLTSVAVVLLIWGVFDKVFGIPLPTGIWKV
jgi:hypothetical protein